MRRVFEREAVEDVASAAVAHQRKHVEDADGARVLAQLLSEVGLTQPAIDVRAGLDAHGLRDVRGSPEAPGQIDLTEPALAEKPLDVVVQSGLRALDDLVGAQVTAAIGRSMRRMRGAGGGLGRAFHGQTTTGLAIPSTEQHT